MISMSNLSGIDAKRMEVDPLSGRCEVRIDSAKEHERNNGVELFSS